MTTRTPKEIETLEGQLFAARRDERERCAKVVETQGTGHGWNYSLPSVGREMAARIRALEDEK